MKKTDENRINKVNEILNKAALSEASIKWWEQQVDKALLNLERLDASLCETDPNKRQKLIDELMLILRRSEIELKVIYEIEKEIEEFTKPQKKSKKGKNKRSPD